MNTLDVLRTAEQLKFHIDALVAAGLLNDKLREQKLSALKQEHARRESEIWAVRDGALNNLERNINHKISQIESEYGRLTAIGKQCRYKRFYNHPPVLSSTAKCPDFAAFQKIIRKIDEVGIMASLARTFRAGTKPRDELVEEFHTMMGEARTYYDNEIAAAKKSGDSALLQIQQNALIEMDLLEKETFQQEQVIAAEYKRAQDELAERTSALINGSLPEKLNDDLTVLTQTTLIDPATGGLLSNGSAHAQRWLNVLLGMIIFDMSAPNAILSAIVPALKNLTDDGKLPIPLSTEKGRTEHLLFKFEPSTKNKITNGILMYILRLLAYHQPRGIRFSIIDSLGRGSSVDNFVRFFGVREKIMSEKALYDSRKIEEELAGLDNMISERIQLLGGNFQDITDYNAQNSRDYRHYHNIVIFDYPEGISRRSMTILDRIVENGGKAGVSVILIASAQSLTPDKNTHGNVYAEFASRNASKFTCISSDEAEMSLSLAGKKYTFAFDSASNDAVPSIADALCAEFIKNIYMISARPATEH